MNNQFATQHLLNEMDTADLVRVTLSGHGASKEAIDLLVQAVEQGLIELSKAEEIIKSTTGVNETSSVGGMVTGGPTAASATSGNGEQYFPGTSKRKFQESEEEESKYKVGDKVKHNNQDWEVIMVSNGKYKLKSLKGYPPVWVAIGVIDTGTSVKEDAPRLAGSPAKTNKQGAKNLSAYKNFGFTKAPTAAEAGKKLKSIDVEELWEANRYSQFKKETSTRSKPQQMHEAAKIINRKLEEINKLLEFTRQMKNELSEGDQVIEYSSNTKKVFEKIHNRVVEVYSKLKKLG